MTKSLNYLAFLVFLVFQSGCSSPAPPAKSEPVPNNFKVTFDTSKGPFVVEVHRDWAPLGAGRFYELVKTGFFTDARFFRIVKGFVVQFGINKDPDVEAKWRAQNIQDDPVKESNKRGYLTYATAGPNTRTTQLFINLADNAQLDAQGFAPFGQVVEGMDVVENLYAGYGEQPQQPLIESQGNQYLQSQFPQLDYVKSAKIAQ